MSAPLLRRAAQAAREQEVTSGTTDIGPVLAVVFDAWARMGRMDPDLLQRVGGPETVALARMMVDEEDDE